MVYRYMKYHPFRSYSFAPALRYSHLLTIQLNYFWIDIEMVDRPYTRENANAFIVWGILKCMDREWLKEYKEREKERWGEERNGQEKEK